MQMHVSWQSKEQMTSLDDSEDPSFTPTLAILSPLLSGQRVLNTTASYSTATAGLKPPSLISWFHLCPRY